MIPFLITLGIVAWITVALWPAFIAKRKGYNFFLFLLLTWVTSILVGLLVALLVHDKTKTPQDIAADKAAEAALERDENSRSRKRKH